MKRQPFAGGLLLTVAVLSVLILVIPVRSEEAGIAGEGWPQWGGVRYDGTAREPAPGIFDLPFELHERWRRPNGFGISSLVVTGGKVTTITSAADGDFVFALDAESGELLWRQPLGKGPAGQAEFGAVTTPASDGSRIFLLSSTCHLQARSAADGSLIWSQDTRALYNTGALRNGCWSSPLLVDGRLIVQINGEPDKRVMAFDPATGKILWASPGVGRSVRSTATVGTLAGKRQIVVHDGAGARQGGVYGIDPENGEVLWSVRFAPSGSYSYDSPILVNGDRVVQLAWNEMHTVEVWRGENGFEARSGRSAKDLKAGPMPGNIHTVADGVYLYGFQQDHLTCLHAVTGEVMWREKIYQGSLIRAGGHLVVLSQAAGLLRIVEASPSGYREKARLEVFAPGAATDTPPSLVGRWLYLRNSEEIAAFEIVTPAARRSPGDRVEAIEATETTETSSDQARLPGV